MDEIIFSEENTRSEKVAGIAPMFLTLYLYQKPLTF